MFNSTNNFIYNIDLFEVFLQELIGSKDVWSGETSLFIRNTNFDKPIWFDTKTIVYHATINSLDKEIIIENYTKIFPNVTTLTTKEIVDNAEDKLVLDDPSIDLDAVKFSLEDHMMMEYFCTLYKRLLEQTNNFSYKELGERIVILPNNFPRTFDGIVEMLKPIMQQKLDIEELLKENSDFLNLDMTERAQFMKKHNLFITEDGGLEQRAFEGDNLTDELLEKYREKYNLIINVDSEHHQVYTRGRFLVNMFVELNDEIKKGLVRHCFTNNVPIDEFNKILGSKLQAILTYYQTVRLDVDNYPVFSRLYSEGALMNLTYPKDAGCLEAKMCYKDPATRIHYTIYFYEGNDGDVRILCILHDTDYSNFIPYLRKQQCSLNCYVLSHMRKSFQAEHLKANTVSWDDRLIRLGSNRDPNFIVSYGNSDGTPSDGEMLRRQLFIHYKDVVDLPSIWFDTYYFEEKYGMRRKRK